MRWNKTMKFQKCIKCKRELDDIWIPIKDFMEITGVTRDTIRNRVCQKVWHDGRIVRKNANLANPGGPARWNEGNVGQYREWRLTTWRCGREKLT